MAQFALDKSHRDYFRDHGNLILEELIEEKKLLSLSQEISKVMRQRGAKSPEEQFLKGRDVWRDSASLEEFVTSYRLAKIVNQLSHEKQLRLAFDQWLPSPSQKAHLKAPFYQAFLEDTSSLSDRTALQGISFGLLLCLKGAQSEHENTFFPLKPGDAVFFRPDTPLPFTSFPSDAAYLLIAYCNLTTLYIRHPKDPHEGALKGLGYVFGDRLSDKLHPILYRQ